MPLLILNPGEQGDSKDGRGLHRALPRDWERWRKHQKGDGGHILPHPFPRLQPPQYYRREKQPGDTKAAVKWTFWQLRELKTTQFYKTFFNFFTRSPSLGP